jgi:hypothetical protein
MTKFVLSLSGCSFCIFLFIITSFFTGEFLGDDIFSGLNDLFLFVAAFWISGLAYLSIIISLVFGYDAVCKDKLKFIVAAILAAVAPLTFILFVNC